MEDDKDGENFVRLWNKKRDTDQTSKTRRKREMRSVPSSQRRAMRGGELKDFQFNARITPSLKARLDALATAERCSFSVLLEHLVNAYTEGAK